LIEQVPMGDERPLVLLDMIGAGRRQPLSDGTRREVRTLKRFTRWESFSPSIQ
jgi:hypothetical protein